MSSTIRNTILLVGLLAVGGYALYTFFLKDDGETLVRDGLSGKEQIDLETQSLVARLQDLEQIKIDQSLFADPRFMSLQNWRKDLPEEQSGRSNPFAPAQ